MDELEAELQRANNKVCHTGHLLNQMTIKVKKRLKGLYTSLDFLSAGTSKLIWALLIRHFATMVSFCFVRTTI